MVLMTEPCVLTPVDREYFYLSSYTVRDYFADSMSEAVFFFLLKNVAV